MASKYGDISHMSKHYTKALDRYEHGEGDSDEYDSEEEERQIAELEDDDKAKYDELKELCISQLVNYGRTMPIDEEIRRHMFKFMPGVPDGYASRASKAVKERRQLTKELLEPSSLQQDDGDEAMIIKVIPGPGPPPQVKEEPLDDFIENLPEEMEEEAEEDLEAEVPISEIKREKFKSITETIAIDSDYDDYELETAEDTNIDDLAPKAVNRDELLQALEKLEITSKRQSEAYKELRGSLPQQKDSDIIQVVKSMPTPIHQQLSPKVVEFLEEEEDLTIRYALAVGMYYLELHRHSKDPAHYPKPRKGTIAAKFGITTCKFSALHQGISYKGGSASKAGKT